MENVGLQDLTPSLRLPAQETNLLPLNLPPISSVLSKLTRDIRCCAKSGTGETPRTLSRRIGIAQRIAADIGVSVDAAFQPNRIALHVSSDAGVVVPEVVVMEVGLLV